MSVETSKAPGNSQTGEDPGMEHVTMTRAAGLVGGLTLASRVTGLVRDMVVGAVFGASATADAFFVAFRIPNLFRRVVAEGATSAAFVPVFSDQRARLGDDAAVRAAGAVGGVAFATLAGLVAVCMLYAAQVVSVFAPGFQAGTGDYALTVRLTRFVFPYLFFVGLAAWAMGTLHSFKRFTMPAVGPILLNVSIVTCVLLLSSTLRKPIYALVAGVLIGGLLQFAVQVPTLFRIGVRPAMALHVSHEAVKRVGVLLMPALLGGAVYQVNVLVATVLATLLPARSVSYLWYAGRIFEFPLGIVAVAVGTAALPSMSGQAGAGRFDALANTVSYSLRLVWALAIPATVGLWILAPPIVSVLFERGAFSATDAAMTTWALRAYVIAMVAVATTRVLVAAFYALQLPRLPVVAACVALVVNVIADLAFMGPPQAGAGWWGASVVGELQKTLAVTDMRHAGLALGAGLAAISNAMFLSATLRLKLAGFRFSSILPSAWKHLLATVAMAAAVLICRSRLEVQAEGVRAYLEVAIALPLGIAVYLGSAWLLGSEEIRHIFAAFRRRG